MLINAYESKEVLDQYLHFHYAHSVHYSEFIPKEYLDFPVRCVTECVTNKGMKALDIGCAVGRTSFELSKHFNKVIGIDYSEQFIKAADSISKQRAVSFKVKKEGELFDNVEIKLPDDINFERVEFKRADAQFLDSSYSNFDLVIAANLLCRLSEPETFLVSTKDLVNVGGQLVLISPYSWLEEYTAKSKWLSAKNNSEKNICEILNPNFSLISKKELPFVIREHARKYQFGISQALIFVKK